MVDPKQDQNEANRTRPQEPPTKPLTERLSLPPELESAPPRKPTGNTALLGQDWRVVMTIGDHKTGVEIQDRLIVGRSVENESDPEGIDLDLGPYSAYQYGVSRQHAVITLRKGYLYLEDLGSTNGTRINGFQLTAHQKYRLRDGDEIEFSRLRTIIRFERTSG